VEALG